MTYTYHVTNNGETPLVNVVVTDDTCPAPDGGTLTLESGDTGDDGILEPGEDWVYSCTMTLTGTTTNEACANGDFIGGGHDEDCKQVTVEVNPPEQSVAESVAESVPPPSVEQSVEAGTGTPAESQPDTSLNGLGGGVLPTILFSFVLIGSLGTLAYANVRAMRRRS